jgi:hypothetical protein
MLIPLVVNGTLFKQWQIGSSSPKVYRSVAFTLNPLVPAPRQRNGLELVTTGRCLVAGSPFSVGVPASWVAPPPTPESTQFFIDGFSAILCSATAGPHIFDGSWTTDDVGAEPDGLLSALYGAVGLGVSL